MSIEATLYIGMVPEPITGQVVQSIQNPVLNEVLFDLGKTFHDYRTAMRKVFRLIDTATNTVVVPTTDPSGKMLDAPATTSRETPFADLLIPGDAVFAGGGVLTLGPDAVARLVTSYANHEKIPSLDGDDDLEWYHLDMGFTLRDIDGPASLIIG